MPVGKNSNSFQKQTIPEIHKHKFIYLPYQSLPFLQTTTYPTYDVQFWNDIWAATYLVRFEYRWSGNSRKCWIHGALGGSRHRVWASESNQQQLQSGKLSRSQDAMHYKRCTGKLQNRIWEWRWAFVPQVWHWYLQNVSWWKTCDHLCGNNTTDTERSTLERSAQ